LPLSTTHCFSAEENYNVHSPLIGEAGWNNRGRKEGDGVRSCRQGEGRVGLYNKENAEHGEHPKNICVN